MLSGGQICRFIAERSRTCSWGGAVVWGIEGQNILFKLKRPFYKGELNHYYIGKNIHDEERYNELTDYREGVQSSYFHQYRAAVN